METSSSSAAAILGLDPSSPKAAPHLPGQPMHRRELRLLRRHPAQGDLMLGNQAVNHGTGIVTTMAHAVNGRNGEMGSLAPVGYFAAVKFVGCGMVSCLPRLLPRAVFSGLSLMKGPVYSTHTYTYIHIYIYI